MSYLDEISDGGYYLNAFSNLLKRRQMENAAQNQMVSSGGQMPQMMMGGGGDGRSSNPGWDSMTNTQKAAYYSDNPTMAAVTQFGQQALNYAPFGVGMAMQAQKAMFPDFAREQGMVNRGIDPATGLQVGGYSSLQAPNLQSFDTPTPTPTGLYGDDFAGMPAPAKPDNFLASLLSGILRSSNVSLTPAPVESREATPVGFSSPAVNFGKESSIPTGGIVSPGVALSRDDRINAVGSMAGGYGGGAGAPGANSDGFGGGDAGFGGGSKAFNQGGMVNAQHLMGRAPAPDDGYGALQGGEYVITKAAVEKYGKRMMDAINNGTFR